MLNFIVYIMEVPKKKCQKLFYLLITIIKIFTINYLLYIQYTLFSLCHSFHFIFSYKINHRMNVFILNRLSVNMCVSLFAIPYIQLIIIYMYISNCLLGQLSENNFIAILFPFYFIFFFLSFIPCFVSI